MAKHLLLDSATSNWRLHVSENPSDVIQRLQEAEPGVLVTVKVVLPDQLNAQTIWVNPSQLGWWTVIELPDADSSVSQPT
ncbi:hypothetical protein ACO229_23325 [Promicromonospora sp. MS192]|uniref:hypothetical protein n=1 Tax=Promicromonospora sp. MS192 TaxID=3412684 RepID=UPI003C303A0E